MSLLDYIKYMPIELRKLGYKGKLNGPYSKRMRPLCFTMNDCEFSFQAPTQSYAWTSAGIDAGGVYYNQNNDFADSLSPYSGSFQNTDRWGELTFFARDWLYNAPWFMGPQARMTMSASYVGPYNSRDKDYNRDFDGLSFYHPSVFENAIADYLRSIYGHSHDGKHKFYRAPVDWKLINLSPDIEAAYFVWENHHNASPGNCMKTHFIAFPIADNRMVLIQFSFSRSITDINYPQMDELAQKVIATLKLEPSAAIKQKIQKMREDGLNTKLSETFPPLLWDDVPIDFQKKLSGDIEE